MTDLLITGAAGFLGSHLVLSWRRRYPRARIGCLVRDHGDAAAQIKLEVALHRAANEAGLDEDPVGAEAIPGDMDDPAWIGRARGWLRGPTELIHCAANLSFREADRAAVWRTNVDGTAALLEALPRLPAITGLDYVSTAYVAGNQDGVILERALARPPGFNNPYEESKWTAEAMVRHACAAAGTPWRIMRPSIVMAHSVTHRMSSKSGFYRVVDTLLQLGQQPRWQAGGPIRLPVMTGTTLDLVPIDVVVTDLLDVIGAGSATAGQTFHLTAADPLQLADVLRELTPMSGVALEVNGVDSPPSPAAKRVMRGLRYYMPYFAHARRFDRRHTEAVLDRAAYRMSLLDLRGFVQSYLAMRPDQDELQDAPPSTQNSAQNR